MNDDVIVAVRKRRRLDVGEALNALGDFHSDARLHRGLAVDLLRSSKRLLTQLNGEKEFWLQSSQTEKVQDANCQRDESKSERQEEAVQRSGDKKRRKHREKRRETEGTTKHREDSDEVKKVKKRRRLTLSEGEKHETPSALEAEKPSKAKHRSRKDPEKKRRKSIL